MRDEANRRFLDRLEWWWWGVRVGLRARVMECLSAGFVIPESSIGKVCLRIKMGLMRMMVSGVQPPDPLTREVVGLTSRWESEHTCIDPVKEYEAAVRQYEKASADMSEAIRVLRKAADNMKSLNWR